MVMLVGTPYFARNTSGLIGTIKTNSFEPSVKLVGKLKPIPFTRQVLVGTEASNNGTAFVVMFFTSTNSSRPDSGLYMISLMTNGPTRGPAFALPGVGTICAGNCTSPTLLM